MATSTKTVHFDEALAKECRDRARGLLVVPDFYETIGDAKVGTLNEILASFNHYLGAVLARGQHFYGCNLIANSDKYEGSENEEFKAATDLTKLIDEIVVASVLEGLSLAGVEMPRAVNIAHGVVGGDYDLVEAERWKVAPTALIQPSNSAMTGTEYVEFLGGPNSKYQSITPFEGMPDASLWATHYADIAAGIDRGEFRVCPECLYLTPSSVPCAVCLEYEQLPTIWADQGGMSPCLYDMVSDSYNHNVNRGLSDPDFETMEKFNSGRRGELMQERVRRAVEVAVPSTWVHDYASWLYHARKTEDAMRRGIDFNQFANEICGPDVDVDVDDDDAVVDRSNQSLIATGLLSAA